VAVAAALLAVQKVRLHPEPPCSYHDLSCSYRALRQGWGGRLYRGVRVCGCGRSGGGGERDVVQTAAPLGRGGHVVRDGLLLLLLLLQRSCTALHSTAQH
jgi:hypothetical protein